MCDNWGTLLLDLTMVEEEVEKNNQDKNKTCPSKTIVADCLILPPMQQNDDHLENNPFDWALQMVNTPEDPFDLLEREACKMANSFITPYADVKMAELISIEDDDKNVNSTDTKMSIVSSTIYPSALNGLPISLSRSESGSCSTSSEIIEGLGSNEVGNYTKFSISNTSFNSPLSHQVSESAYDISTILDAAAHYSNHNIATESPPKLVDDDFDADLEMFSIPMLKRLSFKKNVPDAETIEKDMESCTILKDVSKSALPDISVLREKLRNRRLGDVVNIIQNLKTFICENNLINGQTKEEARNLLEKLSCTLHWNKDDELNNDAVKKVDTDNVVLPTKPIVRQGTFTTEPQEDNHATYEDDNNWASGIPTTKNKLQLLQSAKSLSPAKDIPESMLKSLATYEGEPIEKRENVVIPTVSQISPISSRVTSNLINPNLNEIVEQLRKLLEQQTHSDSSSQMAASGLNASECSIKNPIYVVVMPTAHVSQENYENCGNDHLSISKNNISLDKHDKVEIAQLSLRVPPPKTSPSSPNSTALPTAEAKTYLNINEQEDLKYGSPIRNTTLHYTQYLKNDPNASFSKRLQSNDCTLHYSIDATREVHPPSAHTQAITTGQSWTRANLNTFKPDLKRKVQSHENADSIMQSKAPLKAIIPVKNLAPKFASTLPASNSATNSTPALLNKKNQQTFKMSSKNTPIPRSPSTGASFDHKMGYLSACSTPDLTPNRPGAAIKSFLPTSIAKQQALANTTGLQIRSLTQLQKGQSPVEARSGIPISTPKKCRVSLNPQSNTTKTLNNQSRTSLSSRYSTIGATASKENKTP